MQRLIQFLLPYFSIDASKETGRLGRLVNHGKKNERNASMKEFKGQLVLFAIRYISINILMVFNFCKACLHHFLFYGFILLHVISFTLASRSLEGSSNSSSIESIEDGMMYALLLDWYALLLSVFVSTGALLRMVLEWRKTWKQYN